jgi:hypothetical protein
MCAPSNLQMEKIMRVILLLPVLAVLGGCALPIPVQVASWVIDGISVVTTEKSLSDHGLSMMAGRDCALWRAVTEDQVCRTQTPPGLNEPAPVKIAHVYLQPDLTVQ